MPQPDPLRLHLCRPVSSWRLMRPKAVAEGSIAQVIMALDDAQHDIEVLADALDRLRGIPPEEAR